MVSTLPVSSFKHNTTVDHCKPLPPRKKIIKEAEAIISYYIPYHLRKTLDHAKLEGLPKHYLIPPKHPPDLFVNIARICTELGEDNADFFQSLPETVSLHQKNAKSVYMSLCKTVFEDNIVNWGRIMSLFALAAAFAENFVRSGELTVVTKISVWLCEFVEMELEEWITKQGGWEGVRRMLSSSSSPSRWSRVLAYGAMMATAGFLFFKIGKGKLL